MTLPHGAIAQLGERYAGSVEVRGSSPLGSILIKLDLKPFLRLSRVVFYLL